MLASELFSDKLPDTEALWVEAQRSACAALISNATTANPPNKTPDRIWHGQVSSMKLLPF